MEESEPEADVVIVGGGLAGSLLAVYLSQRSLTVTIVEAREDPRKSGNATSGARSINLALSTRGLTALEAAGAGLGLADRVKALGVPMYGRCVHKRGSLKSEVQQYGQAWQCLWSVPRGKLHEVLLDVAEQSPGVRIWFGEKCTEIDLERRAVCTEGGKCIKARKLLVGADGTWSCVRSEMLRVCRTMDYSQTFISAAYKEIHFAADSPGARVLSANRECLHIWPRGPLMMIALPNSDGSFTGTLFMDRENFDELGDNRKKIENFFKREFPEVYELLPDVVSIYLQNQAPPLVTIRCSPHAMSDKVLLIGDAAHAIVPFYGQGLNAGFEDVRLLMETLDRNKGDFAQTVSEFSTTRKKDTDAIADLAVKNFEEMASKTANMGFVLRRRLLLVLNRWFPSAVQPLYSLISFSNTPYAEAVTRDAQLSRRTDYTLATVFGCVTAAALITLTRYTRHSN